MNLRLRVNLLVTLVFLALLGAGAALVIVKARTAVAEEVRASAHLALQLVSASAAGVGGAAGARLIERFAELDDVRHLRIEIDRDGEIDPIATAIPAGARAPRWFVRLVEPPPLELRRALGPAGELSIRADPSDEIAEAWEEARGMLILLIAFTAIANVLVYATITRLLMPIEEIVAGLDAIEQGDYRSRLRLPALPELSRIALKVNAIAGALERAGDETRYLARKSLAIQEEERRHLARELHDELGQSIAAVNALAEAIRARAGDALPAIAGSAVQIAEVGGRLQAVIRGMLNRLRPQVLDELGLFTALQQLVDDWNERHADVFCELHAEHGVDASDPQVAITVYRIVQEALTNVESHARAARVEISLARGPQNGGVRLEIHDDGIGMDPQRASRGLGMLGIRERIEALNGKFELSAALGAGVRLRMSIPAA
jgi:two-component system sensor histidine kinase UhpB